MRIVITGSIAFDYIMNFPGLFREHILPEKSHTMSVSFLVDSMRKMRGGVAGNIAYTLALLGERPLLFSTAGQDFDSYRALLDQCGVDTSTVREISDEFTASCFITTDNVDNQIVAFYTGAMAETRELSLHTLNLTPTDLVLVSASDPMSMDRLAQECQEIGVPYIFDPGKQTPRTTAESLEIGLRGAQVLIGNDYEFGMMARKLDISEEELIKRAPLTIITRGEQGATFYTNAGEGAAIDMPIVPVPEVADPTGAGDAYLAGVVVGLVHKLPLEITGRLAALAAAYAIAHRGCQEHTFTFDEFADRYAAEFGTNDLAAALAGRPRAHQVA